MTQTSDDINGSGSNASVCKETTTFGIVDHDKKPKKEKVNSVPFCVASSNNTVLVQQSEQMEEVAKVNEAEESTQISSSTEENSDVLGFLSGADATTIENTTFSSTNTDNGSADATSNETVAVTEMELPVVGTFSNVPRCAICGEPCICYCKSCRNVSYCSREHQRKHLKVHMQECFPVKIQVNSVFGSHLVVTRDVRRGEVILLEAPLFIVPFLNYPPFDHDFATTSIIGGRFDGNDDKENHTSLMHCSMCLVCHKIIGDDESLPYTCSKCGWPVCSTECEMHSTHADQECTLFAKYHVDPCDKGFLVVALLRILQHKKEATTLTSRSTTRSSKWAQFMEVMNKQKPISHISGRIIEPISGGTFIPPGGKIFGGRLSFIYKEFSVTDCEIDQIFQTLRTSSFISDIDGNLGYNDFCNSKNSRSSGKSGKLLTTFHLASMLTNSCIHPNVFWMLDRNCGYTLTLRASLPIKTGERITITFLDPLQGTQERRELLWKEKYLSCSCSRCADPSESCTFLSAIKCRGKKDGKEQHATTASRSGSDSCGITVCECEGYVLPTDPLAVTYTCRASSSCCCSRPGAADKVVHKQETDGKDSLPEEKICEQRIVEWKCNVCMMRYTWGFVQNSLERMKRILAEEQGNFCFTTNIENDSSVSSNANKMDEENKANCSLVTCNNLEMLEKRVDKIDSLIGNVAHANHHYILKAEKEVLNSISKHLEKGQFFEEMETWGVRIVQYCTKALTIVNVLFPGLSSERGYYLYALQQGLAISLVFKTSHAMRGKKNSPEPEVLSELMKKFDDVILARKEILDIFALSKNNSREREILKMVQQDSIEVRILKKYFKYHQNISIHKM